MKINVILCVWFILLSVLVAGCGDDDDDEVPPAANITEVVPPDGVMVPSNLQITVEFDNPVKSCTINGKKAKLSYKNMKAGIPDADLEEDKVQTVEIKWVNKDGSENKHFVTYTVLSA